MEPRFLARGAPGRFLTKINPDSEPCLVSLVIQSESMGISVARSLRIYAGDMRAKRLLRAEEHANKLPVRMVLPLGLLVLPAFMIVITSPAIIRIVRVMAPAMSGG
jgi:tight adherence protein C